MEVPTEITETIMLQMPYPDIIKYCQTSRAVQAICGDDSFWRKLYVRDHKPSPDIGKWRQVYEDRRKGVWIVNRVDDGRTQLIGICQYKATAIELTTTEVITNTKDGFPYVEPMETETVKYSPAFLANWATIIDCILYSPPDPTYDKDLTTYYNQIPDLVREELTISNIVGIGMGNGDYLEIENSPLL